MAISYEDFTGDGSNRIFPVNFSYLDPTHVFVTVENVDVTFTFLSPTSVQTTATPAALAHVRVERRTARNEILVEWNIAYIPKEDLDNGYLHPLYVAQEAFDRADESIAVAGNGAWDALGKRFKNLLNGNEAQDAVTKAQLDAAVIAAGNVPIPANPTDDSKVLAASGGGWAWTALTTLLTPILGALAWLGIGQGLEDDGATGLRVKLDGGSLTRGATGIKVSALGVTDVQLAASAVTEPKLAAILRQALHGRCRLTKSGANLLLSPHNGNTLVINGAIEQVPDAGVTLAPTGLPIDTTYYIYAFMSTGVMTLEASTTTWAVQAGTGVTIKTGDATRTLVGLAAVRPGPVWVDTLAKRFVLSYFNRITLPVSVSYAADRSVTNVNYVEVSTTERPEFLTWPGEAVGLVAIGSGFVNGVESWTASLGIDNTTPLDVVTQGTSGAAGYRVPLSLALVTTLSEGFHYLTLLAKSGTGTTTIIGGSTVSVTVRG